MVLTRNPRKRPSASTAISAVLSWSRPCASDMKASERSDVHFTGRPSLARRPGDDGLLGVMVDLAAEAAAHVRRHHAQLVLGQMQHEGAHQQPDHMRVLAGGGQRVLAGAALELADGGARLHRVRHQAVVEQVEPDDVLGARERGIGRGLVADVPVVADVAGRVVMHRDRVGFERLPHMRDGRQRLDLDVQLLRRVLGVLPRVGDHHRDRVADMAHLPLARARDAPAPSWASRPCS